LDVASVLKKLEEKHTQNQLAKDFENVMMIEKSKDETERPFTLLERRPRGM